MAEGTTSLGLNFLHYSNKDINSNERKAERNAKQMELKYRPLLEDFVKTYHKFISLLSWYFY